MKYPYGEANFFKIRSEGYLYIDKTRYPETLKNSSESHALMLHSRRFGKTLFVNMLDRYYDRHHADLFETLFKPEHSPHYFIERKYVKARAAKSTLQRKIREGTEAMTRYLESRTAQAIPNLHAYVLVFRKDRCVQKIAC